MDRVRENVIEWIENDKTALCTFSQKKFVNRVLKMSETIGSPVKILAKNPDGSVLARIPTSAIHIYVLAWNGKGFAATEEGEEKDEEND